MCPLTKLDALEDKNTADPINSSGLPQRAAGVLWHNQLVNSLFFTSALHILVSK